MLAFTQDELEKDIWVDIPSGFQVDGQTEANSNHQYLLKFNISVYGLKQESFNWYNKLKQALINQDFKPSDIDPYLYVGMTWSYWCKLMIASLLDHP